MAAKSDSKVRMVAHNRKARFNYQIGETFEAGIARETEKKRSWERERGRLLRAKG
jgi:tmRNA-binding protein